MSETFDWNSMASSGTPQTTGAVAPSTPAISAPLATSKPRTTAGPVSVAPERLGEALELLRDFAGSLAGVKAQLAEAQHSTVVGKSGGRHVSVARERSGAGLKVTIDESWLDGAHERTVGKELLEALQAAHDAAVRPPTVLGADGPIGRLRALTASPETLMDWLGLPAPKA